MEGFPGQNESKEESRARKLGVIIARAQELSESREVFPFPGLNPADHAKMKIDEEEFPGYTTPIDELVGRFQNEGMKIVLGNHPESGNVFVLPAGSDNIEMDSISPRQLQIGTVADNRLGELISESLAFRDFTKAD